MSERIQISTNIEIDILVSLVVFDTISTDRKYSSSVIDCYRLVEYLVDCGFYFQLNYLPNTYDKWSCVLMYDNSRASIAQSDTPTKAVSLAALKAYGLEVIVS